MRYGRAALTLVLSLALATGAAIGGNEVRPTKIEVVPNFNAASVYAFFDGDDNQNAVAKMEYRAGDTKDFRPGHPLSRTAKGRFAGSIFWLQPDQSLEVRVTFEDPDAGAKPAPLTAAARTRSDKFPAGTGKTYYVSPQGDDAGAGTREKPYMTIARAVGAAEPGDTILLREGTYAESVTVRRSGRPDAYITLRADPADSVPGPRIYLAEGGDFVQRIVRRPKIIGWVPAGGAWQDMGGGLYATDEKRPVGTVTFTAPLPPDAGRPVGTRIYHHGSLDELRGAEPPLVPGWWQDAPAGRLYLRLAPGDWRAPSACAVRLGVLPFGLRFENCGYWVVEGLEFEVFGGGTSGRGIEITSSRNIVVRNCRFDTMRTGISVRREGSRECLIERCTFRDSGIWTWPWKACKSHDVEGSAISFAGGGGNVARFNTITGHFNGIGASTWGDLENEALNRDLDVHDNVFTEIGDDPMEPEGACMNCRFWNNRTFNTLQGISLAPITVGPVYVVRERYVRFKGGAVKAGVSSRGIVFIYHILGWTDRTEGGNGLEPCGPWGNMHFRNSILRATRYVVEDMQPLTAPCSFDYCDLFTTAGNIFIKWQDKRYRNLSEVPADAGFGKHNARLEPYARVEDGRPAGLAPQLIDAGILIPGINDNYMGKAPDIGPEEIK